METKVDTAERVLEAIDIIAKSRVDEVQFDRTIKCTITNVNDAALGEYIVSNGSATFVAYSKDTTYKQDDVVMVTIPQGDYNQQKYIIGKYQQKNSKPFVYKEPLDYYVDITGNLVSAANATSILANRPPQEEGTLDKVHVATWKYNEDVNAAIPLSGFDRLAIKADFLTELKNFRTVSGNYGLEIIISYLKSGQDVAENYANISTENDDTATSEDKQRILNTKTYYFDIKQMYGDPYNFDLYYNQQALFNIAGIDQITQIDINLFQDNQFYDDTHTLIPHEHPLFHQPLMDNIYVKDVYLSLGYDETEFDTDKLILFTANSLTYSSTETNEVNTKNIYARWVHRCEDGEIITIDDFSNLPAELNNFASGFEPTLTWYKYQLSAPAGDEYCGVHWTIVPGERPENETFYAFTSGTINEHLWCTLIPNIELGQEQIKAILTYGTNAVIRSNVLTFTNEKDVPHQTTIHHLEDFYLITDDGLNGVYNLYGNDNKILVRTAKEDGTDLGELPFYPDRQVRRLIPQFAGSTLQNIEYIRWGFPWQNTMLKATNDKGEPLFDIIYNNGYSVVVNNENLPSSIIYESYDNNYVYFSYPAQRPADYAEIDLDFFDFYFRINDQLVKTYINNSIFCEIIKERTSYTTTYNCRFGYYGTNGSDYTLIASFLPSAKGSIRKEALKVDPINTDNRKIDSLKLGLEIMDQNGTILDWNNTSIFGNVTVQWSWEAVANQNNYVLQAVKISHDNIPEYRKSGLLNPYRLEDQNIVYTDYPIYYELDDESRGTYHSLAVDASYDNTKDDQGEYNTNYCTLVWTKEAGTTPHINFIHSITENNESVLLPKNEVILKSTSDLTINELYVLKATVRNLVPYDLITYVPIPLYSLYSSNDVDYKPVYIGPDIVRYDSIGNTDYYKDPCRIAFNQVTTVQVDGQDTINVIDTTKNVPLNTNGLFEIFIPMQGTQGWNSYLHGRDYGTLNSKNILIPLSVYLSPNPIYGIQYKIGNIPYWTQPIFCYQNQWPNGTVNKWDGTGLIINEETGYIMGHSITAGKKESDNTFTGVMLGDLGIYDNIENPLRTNTGIYGFNHGAVSYALKDDGTAMFGKAGHGRIEFNGNEGKISSSSWKNTANPFGMCIDLDDGSIKMRRDNDYNVVDKNEVVNNWSNNNSYYRYVTYKLSTYNSQSSDTYYLPNIFVDPEQAVTSATFTPNKYYLETNTSESHTFEDIITHNYENLYKANLTYAGHENLEDATYSERSETNRFVLESKQPPKFTYQIRYWAYKKYPKTITENGSTTTEDYLYEYVQRIEYYTYTLATARDNIIDYSKLKEPDWASFTPITSTERPTNGFTSLWFYTSVFGFKSCNGLDFDPLETYYAKVGVTSNRYIDIGVDQPIYPLSIGSQASVAGRPFRVDWNGTVHITDGYFTGNIDAKTGRLGNLDVYGTLTGGVIRGSSIYGAYITGARIEADYLQANKEGQLAGWNFDSTGLWNQLWNTGINGIKLYSNVTAINGLPVGIALKNSYITIVPVDFPNGAFTSYGYMGYLASGLPGNDGASGNGVGLGFTNGSARAYVKATERNAGLSYNNDSDSGSLTINTRSDATTIRASLTASQIALQTNSGDNAFVITNNGSTIQTAVLNCRVPAENQVGIYARFA